MEIGLPLRLIHEGQDLLPLTMLETGEHTDVAEEPLQVDVGLGVVDVLGTVHAADLHPVRDVLGADPGGAGVVGVLQGLHDGALDPGQTLGVRLALVLGSELL